MTNTELTARRLLSALFGTALCIASVACGDDSGSDSEGNPSSGSDAAAPPVDASASAPDAAAPSPTSDAGGVTGGDPACLSAMYSQLGDSCKSCACKADPVLAPTCQGACWDFIACSSKAETGRCAPFAAGGAAMRMAFETCTLEECGPFLAVPGAEAVRTYRPVTTVCALPVAGAPAVCAADLAKLAANLKKP